MIVLQRLGQRHHAGIGAHLLALALHDRIDRFNCPVADASVLRYVSDMLNTPGVIIGAVRDGQVIGLVHAALYRMAAGSAHGAQAEWPQWSAEIGLSVNAGARRLGLGMRLMHAAGQALRPLGVTHAKLQFRASNPAVTGLVRSTGGHIEWRGNESSAVVTLDLAPSGH